MLVDQSTARRHERRDGIPCFTIAEAAPSVVVHLFHPSHLDYHAARRIHEAHEADLAKRRQAPAL